MKNAMLRLNQMTAHRHEVGFWANILMLLSFVLTEQYLFAGAAFALAVMLFEVRMISEKIPVATRARVMRLYKQIRYLVGRKYYYVAELGVYKVVRMGMDGEYVRVLYLSRGGTYTMTHALPSSLCRTAEEGFALLIDRHQKDKAFYAQTGEKRLTLV
ncbi:hypothetical protein J2T17_004415 [Paenibacillus mucilaginosus]|uniref:hypothetical protein n=1 Tax=Paenibacillus mucilaginosus TaxID=61624 RepID=UPI003D251850